MGCPGKAVLSEVGAREVELKVVKSGITIHHPRFLGFFMGGITFECLSRFFDKTAS